MSQLGGGYVATTAGGVTAILKDTPAATPAPAQPEAVIENTEKQAEDVNAILEALKKGGLAAVAKLATELTSPSSTEVQEQQSGSEPKQPMEGKGETQHTPMSAKVALVNTDPDLIKERESPRGLESTYSLREVGAGHFSAVFAKLMRSLLATTTRSSRVEIEALKPETKTKPRKRSSDSTTTTTFLKNHGPSFYETSVSGKLGCRQQKTSNFGLCVSQMVVLCYQGT